MKVLVTGAYGFLGWHTCVRLRALTDHEVVRVGRDNWGELTELVATADAVIHVAGVNRWSDEDVEQGNIQLSEQLAAAIRASGRLATVVYAGTIHEDGDSPYGRGKRLAGQILESAARDSGATYAGARLPNLFGEHGRARYNSFVATFVDAVVRGDHPQVEDREIELLHAQLAAETLISALDDATHERRPTGTHSTVGEVLRRLEQMHQLYGTLTEIPVLTDDLDLDLFNTYRARVFPDGYPRALQQHADARGRLVETVRAHGGQGQTFVSTTVPGATRGDHYHLRKVERFVVVEGEAIIRLRRVWHDEVLEFAVSGQEPAVIDMPTMWVHNITNTGAGPLTTMFWTNSLFDPAAPDTYWEPVSR